MTQLARAKAVITPTPAATSPAGDPASPVVDLDGTDTRLDLPPTWSGWHRDPVFRAALLRHALYGGTIALWLYVTALALLGRVSLAGFAAWAVLAAGLAALEWLATRRYNAAVLRYRPEPRALGVRCAACGYALVHLDTPRCPECGRAFRLGDQPYITRAERLSWRALVRTMTLGLVLATGLLSTALAHRVQVGATAMLYTSFAAYGVVVLLTYLVGRSRMKGYRVPPPSSFPCAGCGQDLPTPLADTCPHCARAVRAEEVFVRCKPWNLADQRFRRLSRTATLGQFVLNGFIFLLLVGLLVGQAYLPALRLTGNDLLLILLGILAALAGVVLVRQRAGRAWGHRARLLFTQAVPSCPRCDADLSGQPIRGTCPRCAQAYGPQDLHG